MKDKTKLFPTNVSMDRFSSDLLEAFKSALHWGDLTLWDAVSGRLTKEASVPFYMVEILSIRALFAAMAQIRGLEKRLAEIENRGLSFEGAFQAGKSYRKGQIVVRSNTRFIATKDHATDDPAKPRTPAQWALFVDREARS